MKRDAPNPQAESTGTNETHDDGMASEGTPGADATEAGAVEIESSAGESEERASGIEEPVKTEGQMDEAALACEHPRIPTSHAGIADSGHRNLNKSLSFYLLVVHPNSLETRLPFLEVLATRR